MDNEKYQKILEKCSKEKRDKLGHKYFGDKVSKLIFKLSKKLIRGPILDIGAGTGTLIEVIKNHGYKEVMGIDLYPKVDFVKEGVITDLHFSDNKFKTIFCIEVIEHLTDQQIEQGLNEIYRVLDWGGVFVLTVPFDEILEKNSFVCPHCGGKFHRVGHLQSFSKERITTIARNHGFTILKTRVYALGAMAKLPFGLHFNWLFKRANYDFIGKSLMVVCKKK